MSKNKYVIRQKKRELALGMFIEGATEQEIVEATGYSPAWITRIRLCAGIKSERYFSRLELFAIVRDILFTSKKYAEIREDHNTSLVSLKCIADDLKLAGIVLPDRPQGRSKTPSNSHPEIISDLLNTDKTLKQISEDNIVSTHLIHSVIKRLEKDGIEVPKRRITGRPAKEVQK